MKWPTLFASLLLTALFGFGSPAFAEGGGSPSSFGAAPEEAPLPEVADDDFEGMLQNCDTQLVRAERAKERCEQDNKSRGFLIAAYLAVWVLTLFYLLVLARRQGRLRAEIALLRDRIRQVSEDER